MRLADKYDSLTMMMVAMALQIVGILIPIFSANIFMNLLSGMLFGATFIGLVALFMNFAGQQSIKNPVLIMGAITSAYGVGQIVAPLYCVAFINYYENYNAALLLTAVIVACGIALLAFAKKNHLNQAI